MSVYQEFHHVPFDVNRYPRIVELSDYHRSILSYQFRRGKWGYLAEKIPDLILPLMHLASHAGVDEKIAIPSLSSMIRWMLVCDATYWTWTEKQWMDLLERRGGSRPYLVAAAYHFGGFKLYESKGFVQTRCACAIFGHAVFNQQLDRISQVLTSLGYGRAWAISGVLAHLMIENDNPLLESFTEDFLRKGQDSRNDAVARSVGKISHGLAALGILEQPLRMRNYEFWKEKSTVGIDPEWVEWCARWRETSTLRPNTIKTHYSFMLRIGLWLKRNHPGVSSPLHWDARICADFIAAIDKLNVGDWALESSSGVKYHRLGLPVIPNSKRSFIHILRKFFMDFELWGWGRLKLNPRYHLATPRTIAFNSGVNPRVIDDAFWLKLIWASLNLSPSDLISDLHYPFALVQAVAVIWTHSGLRSNEIMRLSVDCVHAQSSDIVSESGERVPVGSLCYLNVPAGKTFKAFVKPVAVAVKKSVDEWLEQRPASQVALLDERTGELVNFLFQFRGKKVGASLINRTIIPMLCAKAGVPIEDSRGRITSHRARASALTALASVPQGMSILELMQWSGHSSPTSTMHYIRIRPTKLAASFAKADQLSNLISVIIDNDVVQAGLKQPYMFYDLGDSYCTNPFWSSCPHRMACAGCDFNLPKQSAKAQALESKASISRFLQAVPLTEDERGIVEGDLEKINSLIQKLDNIPTPDGRTPSEILRGKS